MEGDPNSLQYMGKEHHTDFGQSSAEERFVLVAELGHGSLGLVQEVKVKGFDSCSVARKKILLPYGRAGTSRRDIIHKEANILKSLRHPHVVSLIASYEDFSARGHRCYSVLMRPVGDRDLKGLLSMLGEDLSTRDNGSQSMPDEFSWLRDWFTCLTSALEYIHSKGIRHEDIKPSNIIHRGRHIFLTDFSSATRFNIGHTTSTDNPARNSAMYAPPEVIPDFFSAGERPARHGLGSDIFSLGCVFLEMLTVLTNRSVEHMHSFCNSRRMESGQQAHHEIFLYSQVVHHMDDWFGMEHILFKEIIWSMISINRKARPTATAILDQLRTHNFICAVQACPCMTHRCGTLVKDNIAFETAQEFAIPTDTSLTSQLSDTSRQQFDQAGTSEAPRASISNWEDNFIRRALFGDKAPGGNDSLWEDYKVLKRFIEGHSLLPKPVAAEDNNRVSPRTQDKLTRLTNPQFQELRTDVCDEARRRLNNQKLPPPPDPRFHPKRNEVRWKLSTFSPERFSSLARHVFSELARRLPEFLDAEGRSKQRQAYPLLS